MIESDQRTLSRVIEQLDAARAELAALRDVNAEMRRMIEVRERISDRERAELAALQGRIKTLCAKAAAHAVRNGMDQYPVVGIAEIRRALAGPAPAEDGVK